MNIKSIINKISSSSKASIDEIAILLESDNTDYLFKTADSIRKKYCGDKVHIRGIIEFSNHCRCKCTYCGINCNNSTIPRYRMDLDEIIQTAKRAYAAGYKTIILQSGEDLWYDREKISYLIQNIKKIGNVSVTLSVGERDYEDYKQWKQDGADRYLLKHETADEDLYNRLHPHSSFQKRIQCLNWLKELGYQLGSGFMIGLPGQSLATIAKDILLLKQLDVDMAGIGPFLPHPETLLKDSPAGSGLLTLKAVAITRILLKRTHLPTTTALEVQNIQNRENAFYTGANVIMRKVETIKYRQLYEIYPRPCVEEKNLEQERAEIESYIIKLGRKIAFDRGDSLNLKSI